MQFAVLSDANADDFVSRLDVPIFRDSRPGRPARMEMALGAVKHDTFVYSTAGVRTLFWDTSSRTLSQWSTEIRAEVEALDPR